MRMRIARNGRSFSLTFCFGECAHRSGGNSAIHQQGLTGHVAARLGCKKNDGAVEVGGLSWPFHRNSFANVFHPLLVFVHHFILLGAKPPGSKAIHSDSMFAPVICQAHGELANSASARAVWSEPRISRDTGDGSNVDNAAIATRNHVPCYGLRHEKTSAKIRVKNQVPIIPGDVESGLAYIASGVVDENIDAAECFVCPGGHALDALLIADVKFEGNSPATEGLDLCLEWRERVQMTAGEHNVRARFCQRPRKVLSKATAGPGHDSDLSG